MNGFISRSVRSVALVGIASLVSWVPLPSLGCDALPNPKAFEIFSSADSQLLPNGMMVITYGTGGGELHKHVTVHRVVMVLPGLHPLLPEAKDPRYKVLETDGTLSPMTYLIVANALYYGVGIDSMGFPQKTWIDSEEDGLNGNERPTGGRNKGGNP